MLVFRQLLLKFKEILIPRHSYCFFSVFSSKVHTVDDPAKSFSFRLYSVHRHIPICSLGIKVRPTIIIVILPASSVGKQLSSEETSGLTII